ncbi:glycosyltransferase [Sinomicrobium sp. M5D2P17]
MKKAFITDWLDKYGGAERVATAINEIFDFDYYYSYVNVMTGENQLKTFAGKRVKVITSKLMTKTKFRMLMPLFPYIVKLFNKQTGKNKVDLVVSSSWAISKGYRVGGEIHVCYLQARNFKYVWEEADLYFKGPLKLFSFLKGYLQKFDVESAQNPDHLIANSIFVQQWVKKHYNRDSVVIYPPVDVEDFTISEESSDYYITVGRLEPYKRFDVIVNAFSQNGKRLIVVGDGTQASKLRSMATSNIEFTGYLDKNKTHDLLSKAKAFVYAGVEDFGIVLVEAHATGVPVIAFKGGAAEEIINDTNGLCYERQTAESLNTMLDTFESSSSIYNKQQIRETALKFSKKRFQTEFGEFITQVIK